MLLKMKVSGIFFLFLSFFFKTKLHSTSAFKLIIYHYKHKIHLRLVYEDMRSLSLFLNELFCVLSRSISKLSL